MNIVLRPSLSNDCHHRENSNPHLTSRSSDHELIEGVARADREAMRLLFQRFKTSVYRFAVRLGADDGAAEDIVSEVFLDVWRAARGFKGQSTVSTWLLAITRNKTAAMMRRRTAKSLDDMTAENIEDDSDGPQEAFQKRQVRSIYSSA